MKRISPSLSFFWPAGQFPRSALFPLGPAAGLLAPSSAPSPRGPLTRPAQLAQAPPSCLSVWLTAGTRASLRQQVGPLRQRRLLPCSHSRVELCSGRNPCPDPISSRFGVRPTPRPLIKAKRQCCVALISNPSSCSLNSSSQRRGKP